MSRDAAVNRTFYHLADFAQIHEARMEQFGKACEMAEKLFDNKNRQYKDSIRLGGVLGAAYELTGILARVYSMIIEAPDAGESQEEDLKQLLLDVHNYANITLMMIADENWKGQLR